MSGWQVGDLALCVDNTPRKHRHNSSLLSGSEILQVGKIYTVDDVCVDVAGNIGLIIDEATVETIGFSCPGWSAARFRKIKPDTEPCEEEFTVLINRGRKVQA